MTSHSSKPTPVRRTPSVGLGFMIYAGYLAVFFATWIINGVDYNRIGENAETTRLWYAFPTLGGCAFLAVALSWLGWWRPVLFDRSTAGPRWLWLLPVAMGGVIIYNFLGIPVGKLTAALVLWSALGAVGVGFGEEMITRGSLVVGLRSRWTEGRVWLISSLAFSALHVPNVLFGFPLEFMPVQVLLTFVMGSGFYAIRRLSGTLLLPMVLHGLWDSALFLSVATGVEPSAIQFAVYPLAIVGVIALVRKTWNERVSA